MIDETGSVDGDEEISDVEDSPHSVVSSFSDLDHPTLLDEVEADNAFYPVHIGENGDFPAEGMLAMNDNVYMKLLMLFLETRIL